ncbi:MAG TPA: AMP-binding protein, partial [Xanthobacteraceae bacterium]|nr:AMP-binding protein [Xanthobacteraceae bacterium]
MNLAHFLLQSAKRYPSEVALVSGEDTLTWAQLNARVDAMAAALAARGVSKGDRILVQAKNSNQLFETMFVCFRLGAIWVPTNFRLTAEEVAYLASASGATAMICGSEFPDHA